MNSVRATAKKQKIYLLYTITKEYYNQNEKIQQRELTQINRCRRIEQTSGDMIMESNEYEPQKQNKQK